MAGSFPQTRLDALLARRGLAQSRSRARDMILRGHVRVDGRVVAKAGASVSEEDRIEVDDPAHGYVSRSALKLVAGLDAADIRVTGKQALDLGASTGGFTQVLLERGARQVAAVDVGHGQMAPEIAADPRVKLLEGHNARDLTFPMIGFSPEIIVCDVSFVSLRIAAEPALGLAAADARCVLLVKPQFEVGRAGVGKGGLVSDETLVTTMLESMKDWFSTQPGWRATHLLPSPIAGGDGNEEFLLCGQRDG